MNAFVMLLEMSGGTGRLDSATVMSFNMLICSAFSCSISFISARASGARHSMRRWNETNDGSGVTVTVGTVGSGVEGRDMCLTGYATD